MAAEVDKELVAALNQAKRKRMHFAMVLKGTDGVLSISGRKVIATKIAAMQAKTGGAIVVRGVCYPDANKLVFETPQTIVGTWGPAARKIARDQGVTINPEFRQGAGDDPADEAAAAAAAAAEAARLAAEAAAAADAAAAVSAFEKARPLWVDARAAVQNELKKLSAAIVEVAREQTEFSPTAVAAAAKNLSVILDRLDARLLDRLDEGLAPDADARRSRRAAAAVVREYRAYVDRDPLMLAIDANGFTPVAVRKTALDALEALAKLLR